MHTTLLWVPGWGEMLIIALFILIFFGAKKIPEIARGMGKGIREFKDATKEVKKEINEGMKDDQ
jgi:sec-independent protein translocase protein TatA